MRKLIAAVAVLAASATLVGCGGDDGGSSGAAISKADFVAQANEICATGNAELVTAMGSLSPDTTAEEIQQVFVDTVIPNIRGQVADIRALGFPAGDEATLDGLFDQVEHILDQAQANPASMMDDTASPFEAVNQQLIGYGLDTCGES